MSGAEKFACARSKFEKKEHPIKIKKNFISLVLLERFINEIEINFIIVEIIFSKYALTQISLNNRRRRVCIRKAAFVYLFDVLLNVLYLSDNQNFKLK